MAAVRQFLSFRNRIINQTDFQVLSPFMMKKHFYSLSIVAAIAALSCNNQEKKSAITQLSDFQEMQNIASELDKRSDSLHIYQGAIRDMLHSFEASFPNDTFTTKLRFQLSELNKSEYALNEWKKSYNKSEDSISMDKTAFAQLGKNEITAVRSEWNYNIGSAKKLIALLKERGIIVSNDPTIQSSTPAK